MGGAGVNYQITLGTLNLALACRVKLSPSTPALAICPSPLPLICHPAATSSAAIGFASKVLIHFSFGPGFSPVTPRKKKQQNRF